MDIEELSILVSSLSLACSPLYYGSAIRSKHQSALDGAPQHHLLLLNLINDVGCSLFWRWHLGMYDVDLLDVFRRVGIDEWMVQAVVNRDPGVGVVHEALAEEVETASAHVNVRRDICHSIIYVLN